MIVWLDQKIFGSGHGIKSPRCDDRYYWLVDPHTNKGELYTWCGWFGSQLQSFQWTHPRAGEERLLVGYYFRPYTSYRNFGRVRVTWACAALPRDVTAANEFLRKLELKLGA